MDNVLSGWLPEGPDICDSKWFSGGQQQQQRGEDVQGHQHQGAPVDGRLVGVTIG